ncbi:hypothetical protein QCN27_03780 [Cereibacter sp. SYSU M97828]|nr:hypothetical protein [Cereibacter flavus]
MTFADTRPDPAQPLTRTAEALMVEAPAYPLPTPANRAAAPDPLAGLSIRFSIPIGFGLRVGIAGQSRAESVRARLRRLEAAVTDDSQGWLERQDAQGDVDLRNLTRAGLVLAAASTAMALALLLS